MADEKQSNDTAGSSDGSKRSRRRYYRRRGKGKKKNTTGQSQSGESGSSSEKDQGSKPEAQKANKTEAKQESRQSNRQGGGKQGGKQGKSGDGKSSSSRRKRRSRGGGEKSSKNRSRRSRRQTVVEPMVEVGVEIAENKNYVEPENVYVYEFMIRPAYRDASDYRPDSFQRPFGESLQDSQARYTSQLGTQYAVQYRSQYPTEFHPEDADYVPDPEPARRPGELIREYFANLPAETDEEAADENQPSADAPADSNRADTADSAQTDD